MDFKAKSEQLEQSLKLEEQLNELHREKIESLKIIIDEMQNQQELSEQENKVQEKMLLQMRDTKADEGHENIIRH